MLRKHNKLLCHLFMLISNMLQQLTNFFVMVVTYLVNNLSKNCEI